MQRAVSDHGAFFSNRLLTEAERQDIAASAHPARELAIRFAAKEACLKALGTGWDDGVLFTDVEVRSSGGRLSIQLAGVAAARSQELLVRSIQLSTTRSGATIGAYVVLES
jgi:holo-[acyl-carrier protein] synthase